MLPAITAGRRNASPFIHRTTLAITLNVVLSPPSGMRTVKIKESDIGLSEGAVV